MYQFESNRESLILTCETSRLRIGFVSESIVRVTMTGKQPFQDRASLSVIANSWYLNYRMEEDVTEFRVATASLAQHLVGWGLERFTHQAEGLMSAYSPSCHRGLASPQGVLRLNGREPLFGEAK